MIERRKMGGAGIVGADAPVQEPGDPALMMALWLRLCMARSITWSRIPSGAPIVAVGPKISLSIHPGCCWDDIGPSGSSWEV